MDEVKGEASDEECAEAEKFNEMVDKGQLAPAEIAQMEKDKTPEEIEAMEKLMDIEEIFYRDGIFDVETHWQVRERGTSFRRRKSPGEVREDLLASKNYFHHVGGNNLSVLKDPRFNSVSCYSFWWRHESGTENWWSTPYYIGGEEKAANGAEISVVLSQSATERARQDALHPVDRWDDKGKNWGEVPYLLNNAEAYFQDQGNSKAILGVIIAKPGLREIYNPSNQKILTEKEFIDCQEKLKPYAEEQDKINQRLGDVSLSPEEMTRLKAEAEAAGERWLEERVRLYELKPASKDVILKIARIIGMTTNIPVLGWEGNLLWPQKMTYEEVKQFVAERKAKKKEKGENIASL